MNGIYAKSEDKEKYSTGAKQQKHNNKHTEYKE
jgi:hypothetical protein